MAQALRMMGDIIISPSVAFSALKGQPRWVFAATVISLCSVVLAVLLIPYSLQIVARMLSDQMDRQSIQRLFDGMRSFSIIGALATPVMLMVKWLIVSAVFFSLAILFDAAHVRFRPMFSAIVHAEMIQLLMGLVNLAILAARGADSIRNLSDLCMVPGLLTLMQTGNLTQSSITLFANFNLFTVWYLMVLSIGLSTLTGFQRWKAGILVVVVWMFTVGFNVAISRFSEMLRYP